MTSKRHIFKMAALLFITLGGCDYARMSDQESISTYEASMPEMPEGTIPIGGGSRILRDTDPQNLENPVSLSRGAVKKGERQYKYYCVFCHGARGDGHGAVGESFFALPANLRSERVQEKSDGQLFYTISFGQGRMPPLAATVAERDRWLIIYYLRSLAGEPEREE
jgi:mono/diheme cytochrome c family protein